MTLPGNCERISWGFDGLAGFVEGLFGVGAMVLLGGALWSAVRLLRRRMSMGLAVANALIAAGTLLLSAGGLLTRSPTRWCRSR